MQGEAEPEHLARLGLPQSLSPLLWRQRLSILQQATDALLYLHTPVPGGKASIVHRDLKPENILLDESLTAYLADTGFAKAVERSDGSPQTTIASNAVYLTKGYLDPIIGQGGEYSALTDGYALGITALVTLTSYAADLAISIPMLLLAPVPLLPPISFMCRSSVCTQALASQAHPHLRGGVGRRLHRH